MKRAMWTYLSAAILTFNLGGLSKAQESKSPKASLSLEGGYGMMNSSLMANPAIWGSAAFGFGTDSLFGIEGGYLKTKEETDSYGSFSIIARTRGGYAGPFAEKLWENKRFGFSLRGGLGAWYQKYESRVSDNGVTEFSLDSSYWLPAASVAGMAYVRLTNSINLGAGVREVLVFNTGDGDVFWGTALMPFVRLSLSF